ncbi:phage tail protein [Hymenobacter rubripertinctus]|uniref:Phage tail protein n=1 Tax=Hymenobacter rubripertinctus TaxID=2029981 RepID=A0A418R797_9BACT|nr:tail fiber protein [Hymenobacter rubripertinctus]RIY13276.1 phage tail protein [Hymenobacter rubripertinctus]
MDAFIGEIRLMGFGITPKGWLPCNGQTLAINTNQALFALLGTTYGGNGVQTFALPDLRGRVAVGTGQGPGLQPYAWGQIGGIESATLQPNEMPQHTHTFAGTVKVADGAASSPNPAFGQYPAQGSATQYSTGAPNATMAGASSLGTTGNVGSSQPHENRQPVIGMNYCIATQGYFPSRN